MRFKWLLLLEEEEEEEEDEDEGATQLAGEGDAREEEGEGERRTRVVGALCEREDAEQQVQEASVQEEVDRVQGAVIATSFGPVVMVAVAVVVAGMEAMHCWTVSCISIYCCC